MAKFEVCKLLPPPWMERVANFQLKHQTIETPVAVPSDTSVCTEHVHALSLEAGKHQGSIGSVGAIMLQAVATTGVRHCRRPHSCSVRSKSRRCGPAGQATLAKVWQLQCHAPIHVYHPGCVLNLIRLAVHRACFCCRVHHLVT